MNEIQVDDRITAVLEQYNCNPRDYRVFQIGNGLINTTFKVITPNKSFILQKINQSVFSQPALVINNADKINQFLAIEKQRNCYSLQLVPQLKSVSDKSYVEYQSADSNEVEVWRALKLIDNTITLESVNNDIVAEKTAAAFAAFNNALSQFDAAKLDDVIPDFHNLNLRMKQLKEAIAENKLARAEGVQSLIDYCFSQTKFINKISDLVIELPLRVTHNDTKINNLLFDAQSMEPVAVIDLDTCMSGFLMNDFGDMVRTCCSNIAEDDGDVSKMVLCKNIFKGLAKGYIKNIGQKMTDLERHSLVYGARLLPFICAVRFLTDYIKGDVYFSVKHPEHNQQRAANQFHLYSLLTKSKSELSQAIESVA